MHLLTALETVLSMKRRKIKIPLFKLKVDIDLTKNNKEVEIFLILQTLKFRGWSP